MELQPYEIAALSVTAEALVLLADWHENQISQADAMNDGGVYNSSIKHHEARRDMLLHEAARLRGHT